MVTGRSPVNEELKTGQRINPTDQGLCKFTPLFVLLLTEKEISVAAKNFSISGEQLAGQETELFFKSDRKITKVGVT